jgi:simple sugar transport system substrate-binding protein
MKKWTLFMLIFSLILLGFSAGTVGAEDKKIKAGFIYVGPVGDYGWSHAHDLGR